MSVLAEVCPICNTEMFPSRYINQSLSDHFPRFIDKDKASFIYYNCNLPDIKSDNRPYPIHTFSKYTTLYGGNLFEGMYLIEHGFAVRIYNSLFKTEIEYYSGGNMKNPLEVSTILDLPNKLLVPDYPKLEKLITKVKNLTPFL